MPYHSSRSLIASLFFVATILHAQSFDSGKSASSDRVNFGTISGTVLSTNGVPIAGAAISIRNLDTGAFVADVLTASDGSFNATVPRGNFEVIARADREEERSVVNTDQPAYLHLTLRAERVTSAAGQSISMVDLKAPRKAQDALQKAQTSLAKDDSGAARKHLEAALKAYPDYASALALLAFVELHGDLARARSLAERAVQLAPESAFNHSMLAAVLNSTMQFSAALPEAENAIALAPQEWHGHFERARALAAMGRLEEALKSASRADELTGGRTLVTRVARSRLLAALGRHDEANDQLNAFIQGAPDRASKKRAAAERLSLRSFAKK